MPLVIDEDALYDRICDIIRSSRSEPAPPDVADYMASFRYVPTYYSVWRLIFYGYDMEEALLSTPASKERVVELDFDEELGAPFFEFRVLHYVDDHFEGCKEVADNVMSVLIEVIRGFNAGGMENQDISVDIELVGIYSIFRFGIEEAVDYILTNDPLLSAHEVIRRGKSFTIEKASAQKWYSAIREWRRYHGRRIRREVRRVVDNYFDTHARASIRGLVRAFRSYGYYVDDEILGYIRAEYLRNVEKREDEVYKIMRRIVKRRKPRSIRQLVSIYRGYGYRGRTEYLLPIAREVLVRYR